MRYADRGTTRQQRLPWVLAIQHCHTLVPSAKEHQASVWRHLHISQPLARFCQVCEPQSFIMLPVFDNARFARQCSIKGRTYLSIEGRFNAVAVTWCSDDEVGFWCLRNFFGKQGSFTSFFSRQGTPGGAPTPDGAASIHGGAAGGFRQVGPICCVPTKASVCSVAYNLC